MTVLHRTPLHLRLLAAAMAGELTWLPRAGVSGCPAQRGARISDPQRLTAFFELKLAGVLAVADEIVVVTALGERKSKEWSVTA